MVIKVYWFCSIVDNFGLKFSWLNDQSHWHCGVQFISNLIKVFCYNTVVQHW